MRDLHYKGKNFYTKIKTIMKVKDLHYIDKSFLYIDKRLVVKITNSSIKIRYFYYRD